MSKLQKKPSALKRGHRTLQNMNFYKFFLLLWVIFALLDPDSEYGSGSGSTGPIEYGSNPDPDPKPCSSHIFGISPHPQPSFSLGGVKTLPSPSLFSVVGGRVPVPSQTSAVKNCSRSRLEKKKFRSIPIPVPSP